MKLSYIGKRASSATTDKERFAEARWKYGSRKDEEFGYIFRCLLDDNGYLMTTAILTKLTQTVKPVG